MAFSGQALLLTDDPELRHRLNGTLLEQGLEVFAPGNGNAAGESLLAHPAAVVFLDLDSSLAKTDFLEGRLWDSPGRRVLVPLVSEASIPRLAAAMERGGVAYIKKPPSPEEVEMAIRKVRRRMGTGHRWLGLYGSSPEIQVIRKLVDQVAASDTHVTLAGEPGVGKRVVGRLIHEHGPRSGARFMQFSCAGFSEEVVLELLFGESLVRDLRPGAERGGGCLDRCSGGTLLLDDIDVLPKAGQEQLYAHLVDARLPGPMRGVSPDRTRIIAVSSRDLSDQAGEGAFHKGLLDAVGRVRIEIPPLRRRKMDIPILADHFCRSGARQEGKPCKGIEPAALAELMRYDWPGNVSELRDILEHAVRSSDPGALGPEDLPSLPGTPEESGPGPRVPGATIYEIEKDAILRTLEATGGSTSKAARILEMSVRKIQYKLKEYRVGPGASPLESRPALAAGPPPSGVSKGETAVAVRRGPSR
jgi:two-component system NtrC family response regulator/two-component system response regulator HydG